MSENKILVRALIVISLVSSTEIVYLSIQNKSLRRTALNNDKLLAYYKNVSSRAPEYFPYVRLVNLKNKEKVRLFDDADEREMLIFIFRINMDGRAKFMADINRSYHRYKSKYVILAIAVDRCDQVQIFLNDNPQDISLYCLDDSQAFQNIPQPTCVMTKSDGKIITELSGADIEILESFLDNY